MAASGSRKQNVITLVELVLSLAVLAVAARQGVLNEIPLRDVVLLSAAYVVSVCSLLFAGRVYEKWLGSRESRAAFIQAWSKGELPLATWLLLAWSPLVLVAAGIALVWITRRLMFG